MKNIKLYEEFNSPKKAEFTEILPKIAELFPGHESVFSDPKSYLGKSSWQIVSLKKIKTEIDAPKVFGEILHVLKSEGYEHKSIPDTMGLVGKDLERLERVHYSINFSSFYDGNINPTIVIPTEYEGKKYYFTIILGKKITEIGLYIENALTELQIIPKSSNYYDLKVVILDEGDLVKCEFKLDDIIPPTPRSDEDHIGQYTSSESSNGKRYSLEMAVVKPNYSINTIEDILPEYGVEIQEIN